MWWGCAVLCVRKVRVRGCGWVCACRWGCVCVGGAERRGVQGGEGKWGRRGRGRGRERGGHGGRGKGERGGARLQRCMHVSRMCVCCWWTCPASRPPRLPRPSLLSLSLVRSLASSPPLPLPFLSAPPCAPDASRARPCALAHACTHAQLSPLQPPPLPPPPPPPPPPSRAR